MTPSDHQTQASGACPEMSTSSDSAFLKPRSISDAAVQSAQVTDDQCDLITFLGVLQKLQIEILPITWQAARQPIGIGATGRINESLIDLHTRFAFKCVADKQKDAVANPQEKDVTKERIIQTFINEIIVLGHPSTRKHPTIVELQGICWDIGSDDEVWPVLVFEKSQYGDLYHFATLPIGRELCIAERLKLCVEIGTAISDMHDNSRLSTE
jgi:Protein tyrosine and serine/threonine kinase